MTGCQSQWRCTAAAGAHKDVVRGVRWLGPTARIVSFSSEKTAHGYRNTLLLTDIRNRSSLAFREVGAEGAPMVGIRASPLGRYILVLLRGAPSEIWAVGDPSSDSSSRPTPVLLHPSSPYPLLFPISKYIIPSVSRLASSHTCCFPPSLLTLTQHLLFLPCLLKDGFCPQLAAAVLASLPAHQYCFTHTYMHTVPASAWLVGCMSILAPIDKPVHVVVYTQ